MRTTMKARGISTSAGAGTAFDIATLTGDYQLRLKVWSTDKTAQFSLEDSVNAFSASLPRWSQSVQGGITDQNPQEFVIHKRDLAALRAGVADAELRWNLVEIAGGAGNVDWEAWIEAPVEVAVAVP